MSHRLVILQFTLFRSAALVYWSLFVRIVRISECIACQLSFILAAIIVFRKKSRAVYQHNLKHYLKAGGEFLVYAHRRFIPESGYGVDEDDLNAFRKLSDERWRRELDQRERGGCPAIWARYRELKKLFYEGNR